MILVSVIIPVYNAGKYIERCIDSVLSQSYSEIEIIIIDDGSTDCTEVMIKEAQRSDRRLCYFKQAHQGVSAARNKGLELCRGEYIVFCDADDYVEKDYVQKLLKHAVNYELTVCGYYRVNNIKTMVVYRESGEISREELFEHALCSNYIGGSCWNKLFSADIIRHNALCFAEDITVGEDMLFCASYYTHCKRIYYIGEALYYYCFSNESVMRTTVCRNKFDVSLLSCLDAAERLKLLDVEKQDIKTCIAYRQVRSAIWLLYQMAEGHYYSKKIFLRMKLVARKNIYAFRNTKYASSLEQMAAVGLYISPQMLFYANIVIERVFRKKLLKY